jgi:hypothetical protein
MTDRQTDRYLLAYPIEVAADTLEQLHQADVLRRHLLYLSHVPWRQLTDQASPLRRWGVRRIHQLHLACWTGGVRKRIPLAPPVGVHETVEAHAAHRVPAPQDRYGRLEPYAHPALHTDEGDGRRPPVSQATSSDRVWQARPLLV